MRTADQKLNRERAKDAKGEEEIFVRVVRVFRGYRQERVPEGLVRRRRVALIIAGHNIEPHRWEKSLKDDVSLD